MRSWLTLALLGAIVAALGAWAYFKPPALDADTHALSRLKAAAVKRVRVERFDGGKAAPAIVLERQAAGWRMIAPLAARAEAGQVERLLGILDARSAARYPAADLARYGLGEPQAKLTIDDQVIAYGAVNPMTREQYVLTLDAVYLVPIARSSTLPRGAEALLARALFAPGENPVRFELPGFAVTLEDGTWKVAPAGEASADERNAWVDGWRHATAVRAARHDGRAPAATIRVRLKDGRTLELGILEREPDLVLVRTDENMQFHFLADAAKRLLSPPGEAKVDKAR
jgi:hypothetical protein